ncbi:MAG: homoserine dehydrogenase [Planctomycetia bacterium]|nr:homoserine dehydrogenase [Planctomycetia bacterium]
MTEPFGIALVGCGTVGGGVAKLLLEQGQRLAERAGRPLALRRVVVRDVGKARAAAIPANLIGAELQTALNDPEVQVVVELVGGTDWARRAILAALAAGKHVVTANKAVLAEHGTEVFDAARKHGRAVAFEACVMGGVPVVAVLGQSLAANQVLSLQGILNGTCNFILTGMSAQGRSYAETLAEAQQRGYAEADPTLDVDGTDAAHKLAILAQLAFGATVPVPSIDRRGIAEIHNLDIRFAQELGYTIKLLGEAWLDATTRQLALHVSPVLLRHLTLLAQVRGADNAIRITGDAVGETLLYGRGAGQMPTASAVVADLIDLAVGRAQRTFQAMKLWSGGPSNVVLRPSATVRSRFYLRLQVADRLGVMADVTRCLADHRISIASVVQHEAPEDHEEGTVPLVIMTHTALTEVFRAAVAALDRLGCIVSPSVYYPVED